MTVETSSRRAATSPEEPWLLYDGECPFCSAYVGMLRLRDSIGPVRLIDAREGGPELAEVRAAGYAIDQGMAFKLDGRIHHGDDCIHRLALLTTPSGSFNRLNAWIFRSETRSRLLYPVLRRGRNAVLYLLGRRGIDA
ncbi:MAG: DCC1-like thiol-disulfide oxidoreductase family protein [Paracoccaceae bacterium]